MDMFVADSMPAEEIRERLNGALPEGLRILGAERIELKSPSLSTLIDKTRYRITFTESWSEALPALCADFMGKTEFVIQRKKKGETQSIDLRHELLSLRATGPSLELVARRGKPLEFARAISGDDSLHGGDIRIEKLEVIFSES